jgi:tRNA(Arg) A34 adenosine deaminase TadA
MECALRQAEVAVTNGQTPFGAVVVDRGGVLVGEGYNTVRSALDPRSP